MEIYRTPLIQQFYKIMDEYRNGKDGNRNLNVLKILDMAGFPNLLNEMSIEELTYLERTSSGETNETIKNLRIRRQFFKKNNQEQQSKSRHR